jgi:hypothetical protein
MERPRPPSLASEHLDPASPQRKKSAVETEVEIGIRVEGPIETPAPAPAHAAAPTAPVMIIVVY